MSISELIRRGAFAYGPSELQAELGALADAAEGAADRYGAAIDDALDYIEASNKHIAAMDGKATKLAARKSP